jgi:hypothetical protein
VQEIINIMPRTKGAKNLSKQSTNMNVNKKKIKIKIANLTSTESPVINHPMPLFAKSRCTVCSHAQIELINKLIAENRQSYRSTALQMGLNWMAVSRHVIIVSIFLRQRSRLYRASSRKKSFTKCFAAHSFVSKSS